MNKKLMQIKRERDTCVQLCKELALDYSMVEAAGHVYFANKDHDVSYYKELAANLKNAKGYMTARSQVLGFKSYNELIASDPDIVAKCFQYNVSCTGDLDKHVAHCIQQMHIQYNLWDSKAIRQFARDIAKKFGISEKQPEPEFWAAIEGYLTKAREENMIIPVEGNIFSKVMAKIKEVLGKLDEFTGDRKKRYESQCLPEAKQYIYQCEVEGLAEEVFFTRQKTKPVQDWANEYLVCGRVNVEGYIITVVVEKDGGMLLYEWTDDIPNTPLTPYPELLRMATTTGINLETWIAGRKALITDPEYINMPGVMNFVSTTKEELIETSDTRANYILYNGQSTKLNPGDALLISRYKSVQYHGKKFCITDDTPGTAPNLNPKEYNTVQEAINDYVLACCPQARLLSVKAFPKHGKLIIETKSGYSILIDKNGMVAYIARVDNSDAQLILRDFALNDTDSQYWKATAARYTAIPPNAFTQLFAKFDFLKTYPMYFDNNIAYAFSVSSIINDDIQNF